MTVAYGQQGAVAVLTIDNPPVNALSVAVRQGLIDGIKRAVGDPGSGDHEAVRARLAT